MRGKVVGRRKGFAWLFIYTNSAQEEVRGRRTAVPSPSTKPGYLRANRCNTNTDISSNPFGLVVLPEAINQVDSMCPEYFPCQVPGVRTRASRLFLSRGGLEASEVYSSDSGLRRPDGKCRGIVWGYSPYRVCCYILLVSRAYIQEA